MTAPLTRSGAAAAIAEGRAEEVVESWRARIEMLTPEELIVYAIACYRLRRLDDARRAAERCLRLDLGNDRALQLLSLIDADPERAAAQGYPAWRIGEEILGDFVVEEVLGRGGFGEVYRVSSRASRKVFAAKRALVHDRRARANLLAEVQRWMSIPDHPNVAACRFVRTARDEVVLFGEFAERGAMRGRLAMRELLDAAIQAARGLAVIHRAGLIHQDVKPANLLRGFGGIVQVSDFGLARGSAGADERVSVAGLTLAYASPEQLGGEQLTSTTDVWSLGVSILEWLVGDVSWQLGAAAPLVLEQLAAAAEPAIPASLVSLLRECFDSEPARRPDMEVVAARLQAIWHEVTSTVYLRRRTDESLIDDAIDAAGPIRHLLELRWYAPETWRARIAEWIGRALEQLTSEPGAGLRALLIADLAAFDTLAELPEMQGSSELAELLLDRATLLESLGDSGGATASVARAIEIARTANSARAEGRALSYAAAFALSRHFKGNVLRLKTHDDWNAPRPSHEVVRMLDRAIGLLSRLPLDDVDVVHELARAHANRSHLRSESKTTTDDRAILDDLERAIALRGVLVARYGLRDWGVRLARVHGFLAMRYWAAGRESDARIAARRALTVCDETAQIAGARDVAIERARTTRIAALVEHRVADDDVIAAYATAIEGGTWRPQFAAEAARMFLEAASDLDGERAVALARRAVHLLRDVVARDGHDQFLPDLAFAERRFATCLGDAGAHAEALEHFRAVEVIARHGRGLHPPELAEAMHNHANSLRALGLHDAALARYRRAVEILHDATDGAAEMREVFKTSLARLLWQRGELDEADTLARTVLEGQPPPTGRALLNALHVRGNIAEERGDHAVARASLQRVCELARSHGDLHLGAAAAMNLVSHAFRDGDLEDAAALSEAVVADSGTNRALRASGLMARSRVHELRGDRGPAVADALSAVAEFAHEQLSSAEHVREAYAAIESAQLLEGMQQVDHALQVLGEVIERQRYVSLNGLDVANSLLALYGASIALAYRAERWDVGAEHALAEARLKARIDHADTDKAFDVARFFAMQPLRGGARDAPDIRRLWEVERWRATHRARRDAASAAHEFGKLATLIASTPPALRRETLAAVESIATERARMVALSADVDPMWLDVAIDTLREVGDSQDPLPAREQAALCLMRAYMRAAVGDARAVADMSGAVAAAERALAITAQPEDAAQLARLLEQRADFPDADDALGRAIELWSVLAEELPGSEYGRSLAAALVHAAERLAQAGDRGAAREACVRAADRVKHELEQAPNHPALSQLLAQVSAVRASLDYTSSTARA